MVRQQHARRSGQTDSRYVRQAQRPFARGKRAGALRGEILNQKVSNVLETVQLDGQNLQSG